MLFGLQLHTSLADPTEPGKQIAELAFHGDGVEMQWANDLHGDRSCRVRVLPPPSAGALPPRLGIPDDAFRLHGHAVISYGMVPVFEGRIAGPHEIERGEITGFDLEGYARALQSRIFLTTDTMTWYAGELLQWLVTGLVPGVYVSDLRRWTETGAQITASEMHQSNPAALAEIAARMGDGNGTPVRWAVLPGREFTLVPVGIPDVADYEIALNYGERRALPVITSHRRDGSNIVTAASIVYQQPGASTTVSYPRNELELLSNPYGTRPAGYVREVVLQGGQMTDAAAEQYLTTYLRMHSDPSVEARIVVSAADGAMLTRPSGAMVPGYLARAGEWLTVGTEGPLLITEVSCRAGADEPGRAEITAVSPQGLFDATDPTLYAMQVARHNAARINPVTGTRERS